MSQPANRHRRQFLRTLVTSAAAGLAVSGLLACPSDTDETSTPTPDAPPPPPADAPPGDAPPATANCLDNGTTIAISSNHGHALVVSKEDIAAGVEKIYDITGGAGHSHSVTISAAQFAELAGNTSIEVVSTSAGHTHTCTVSCA